MQEAPTTRPIEDLDEEVGASGQRPATVILFNDDIHTFDEVIAQVMKATGCSLGRAEAVTWEVHTRGKSAVFDGAMAECLRVSAVLEEIALHTTIEVA